LIRRVDLYNIINKFVRKSGFDIRRFPTQDQRILLKYLHQNNISDCFDVGANTGQFAQLLGSAGFTGKIYSFEPQTKAFELLKKKAAGNSLWNVYNIGLSDADGMATIHISKNSVSSSMLPMSDFLEATAPETTYVSSEEIKINRLDSFIKRLNFNNRFFLKIDAQGLESKILAGAENCFNNIYALQLELSCVSLYNGEKLFDEMKGFVESKGFYLSSLESGFTDPKTGRLLQVDAIFLREL
jgi:FkbM family methyltransferase